MLDERGHVKLTDFGTAKAERTEHRLARARHFAALEVAQAQNSPVVEDHHRETAESHEAVQLAKVLDSSASGGDAGPEFVGTAGECERGSTKVCINGVFLQSMCLPRC
jgi:serine/threonine protein kinase